MLNINKNLTIKIIGSIFAAINLGLISSGLVSCSREEQKPLAPIEQQKPVQQPNQSDNEQDDDNDDEQDNDNKKDDKD